MWFQQLFGKTDRFALSIAYADDPHPETQMPELLVQSWGSLKLWVDGHCLTRCIRADGAVAEGIDCYLLPLLEWLFVNAGPMLNEEAFPAAVRREHIASAAAWMDASDGPAFTMTTDEEDDWYDRRWNWWYRHSLRGALRGVAIPNAFFRRVAGDVEVSWDNANWESVRRDIAFVHEKGTARIGAKEVAEVVGEALRVAANALNDRTGGKAEGLLAKLGELDRLESELWLVPQATRKAIESAGLQDRIWPVRQCGLFAEHTLATMLLRSAQVAIPDQVVSLLSLCNRSLEEWPQKLAQIRSPEVAPARKPWEQGYERALSARSALGLDDGCVGTSKLSSDLKLSVLEESLPPHLPATVIVAENKPGIVVNTALSTQSPIWNRSMMLATGLGHLLMDPFDQVYAYVHSPTSDWPTAARARAFGAMFLMPADGVRKTLRAHAGPIDAHAVERVMAQFGTGFHSTAYHLHNLGYLSNTEHFDLVASVGAA